jgi:NTP pyrophosphatase (non-canonical NTP hydrolase)
MTGITRKGLAFGWFSLTNMKRCRRWHPGFPKDSWTGADWSNAMAGEAGEAANVVKKLRRIELGTVQAAGDTRADLIAKLADEVGDVVTYADLLATFYGLDLGECVRAKFNKVSEREGFPERIPEEPLDLARIAAAIDLVWDRQYRDAPADHGNVDAADEEVRYLIGFAKQMFAYISVTDLGGRPVTGLG